MSLGRARKLTRTLQHLVPRTGDGVCVLAYHLVEAGTSSPVDIPLAELRAQLDFIAQNCRTLRSTSELFENGASPEDKRPRILITVDDAYANFFEVFLPEIENRGLAATLYVPVGFIESECPSPIHLPDAATLRPMTWAQIREVSDSGLIEVGSHSWTHPDMRATSPAARERELEGSKRRIEDRIGAEVSSFCFPRALSDRAVEGSAGRVYETAMVAGGRKFSGRRKDRVRVSRVPIRSGIGADFDLLTRSAVWLEEFFASTLRLRRRVTRSDRSS